MDVCATENPLSLTAQSTMLRAPRHSPGRPVLLAQGEGEALPLAGVAEQGSLSLGCVNSSRKAGLIAWHQELPWYCS